MEEDNSYEPDVSGNLELRYRGWSEIEPRVLSFADCLLRLDVSFNQLNTLNEIANLHSLQELNCACNKLKSLPASLASLKWLRVIKANGNAISSIPFEIGHCKALESLNLSENVLTSIPQELAGCTCLHTLLLQNNDLSCLPLSLAGLTGQLQQVDVSNNNKEMAITLPAKIHRDAQSILWILSLQQEKYLNIDKLEQEMKVLQHENALAERELSLNKDRIAMLEKSKMNLEKDMESAKYFIIARTYYRNGRRKLNHWWRECKRACASKYTEIRPSKDSVECN